MNILNKLNYRKAPYTMVRIIHYIQRTIVEVKKKEAALFSENVLFIGRKYKEGNVKIQKKYQNGLNY